MKPEYCAYITIYTATFTFLHQIPRQRYQATVQGNQCLKYLAVLWIPNIFGTVGSGPKLSEVKFSSFCLMFTIR